MPFWYPPEDSEVDPSWWDVLQRVAELTRYTDELPTFAICEFMFMGREDRRNRRIWLYKHIATRRYVNLDDDLNAYRYVAPADLNRDGRYLRHKTLSDALEHLELDLVATEWRYDQVRGCPVCGDTVFPMTDGTLVH